MASYLFDTNHISPLVTPEHNLRSIFTQHKVDGKDFHIASPALAEMLFGIQMLPRVKSNLREWKRFEKLFTYHSVDKQDAEYAGTLQTSLRQQGWQLGTVDALIASVALRYDLILLTTDNDYSAVPGLICQNWLS
ncbi:MAG: type II toxin-antitoxin system VapC family toxin [Chloroflexota bacterium]